MALVGNLVRVASVALAEQAEPAVDADADAALLSLDHHDRVLRRYVGEGDDADGGLPEPEQSWWRAPADPAAAARPATPTASPAPAPTGPELRSLHCAVFRQDQAAVDRLLAAGADPDEPDYAGSGDTPLMQAVTSGHLGIVRSLCAAGCSVDARRVNGQAALTLCVVSRASRRSPRLLLQLLEALLAAGADPGVREKLRGQTALHALAKVVAADPGEPHLLTALRLLAQRAQPHGVNAQDHRRRTALHHLAGKGCARPEPYQILLEARADPALQNARGDTPLVELLENAATAAGDGEEVVRLLAGRGMGAVSRLTQYGESALHVAARRNRAAAVRVILAAGADPAHQDLRGNTALHLAAGRGYKEVVSLLLSAPGCPVNAVNRDNYTPLHVAVESGFVDVVNTLLSAEGVEVGPSVLELAHQEYRLRAQPQLANTLARELDRRGSRASLSLSLSSDSASSAFNWTRPSRPPSTSSYSTSASSSTQETQRVVTPRPPSRSPSRRGQADDEDAHPVNYLGAQVSCTARIRPRYSPDSDRLATPGGCLREASEAIEAGQPHQQHDDSVDNHGEEPLRRALAVDASLREAAELMQKLCDEDLSASPPADWSPPVVRVRPSVTAVLRKAAPTTDSMEPLWLPRAAATTLCDDAVRNRESCRGLTARADEGNSGSARPLRLAAAVGADVRRGARPDSLRECSTESRRSSARLSSDSGRGRADLAAAAGTPSRKFRLPANPYATIRGCPAGPSSLDADADTNSDYLVESLLAVAKSITEPDEVADVNEQFDRTGEIPKDYDLFERSVLFGQAGGAVEERGLRALRRPGLGSDRPPGSNADTAIASR